MTLPRNILAQDPTAGIEYHRPDDRFVPVAARELAQAVAQDTARFGDQSAALRQVADLLANVIDQEAAAFESALAERYAPFNPDRETLAALWDVRAARTTDGYAQLLSRLEYLLDKANFERLTDKQLRMSVRAVNSHGLRVRLDPQRIEHLSIWSRGQATLEKRTRNWRYPWLKQTRRFIVFRRLVLVTRLRDDPNVQVKLFKEIPAPDIEALLPHAEVAMNWFDRLMVFGGSAGMAGSTASKIFGLAANLAYWSKLVWVLLIGGGVLTLRAVLGFRTAQTKRDSQRTKNLYYQNLDNNAGVIHTLVSMVAQEELKEAFLAYALCYTALLSSTPGTPLASEAELGQRVEAYLLERFGAAVAFDVRDAVKTLNRLKLWQNPARFEVLPPDKALECLHELWQSRFSLNHHENMIQTCGNHQPATAEQADAKR